MSDLYLRSVELSNFRIYGDSYAYEFPDGPGVILITGANGVGKTSFFDGVEWALTNQVSRFQDISIDNRRTEQDPLTRIGAELNSHRVSLQFSDGAPIDRGLGFEPDADEVSNLLKRADWAPISSLQGYLSITHFLGQAATRRFSLRKPKDQWEALKGPAGVDRINALRERMSGQGARQAFTRAIRERTDKLQGASDALLEWNELIANRDRSLHLASSDQALTPAAVSTEIEALAERVLLLAPAEIWSGWGATDDTESALHRLKLLIGKAEAQGRSDAERLDALTQLVTDFDRARDESTSLGNLVQEMEERRSVTAHSLGAAERAVDESSSVLAALEREAAQEQHRSVVLARVVAAARQLDEAQAQVKEMQLQMELSLNATAAAQQHRKQLRDAFDATDALLTQRRAIFETLNLARLRVQISVGLGEIANEYARISALISQRDITAIRRQRVDSEAELNRVKASIAQSTTALRQHDDRVQALSQAVSAIALRLIHDDTNCPVCATEFPPGQLKMLARARIGADVTSASDLASSLAAAQLQAEEASGRLVALDREIAEHDQLQATLAQLASRAAAADQQLIETGGSPDKRYDGTEVAELEAQLTTLDAALSAAETLGQIKGRLDEVDTALRAEEARQTSAERARARAAEALEITRSTLNQYPNFWSATDGLLIDLAAEITASSERSMAIGTQIEAAQAALTDHRVARDLLRETEASDAATRLATDAKLDHLVTVRQTLTTSWFEAGQSGEPNAARLAQRRALLEERVSRLAPIREGQERLVAGFRKWLNDNQLRDMERRISTILQAEDRRTEEDVVDLLSRRVEAARTDLDVAQRTRQRMADVGDQMTRRAETFADDVLVPLNKTIQRFARTLMTWSDESITYRAEHHATSSNLRPGIVRVAPDGSTTQLPINPNYYFSEGQLSALSIAALFAASTTFGWSRWRGLLLDDPLQHNDVIHASAFMDLLRQMVRELGYQIILSTHDSTEAEFLVRKCRSAGIPFCVHELVPRGDNGLVSAAAA